ncbi:unnamed protein product [Leptosia nina]|uniref:Uncharacterized protein n=1 Tax=Leptosia nina TaxID=320188 RepID=A0AAV1JT16_9NEOP
MGTGKHAKALTVQNWNGCTRNFNTSLRIPLPPAPIRRVQGVVFAEESLIVHLACHCDFEAMKRFYVGTMGILSLPTVMSA